MSESKPTTATQPNIYDHQCMTPAEFGLYTLACRLANSRKDSTFYFNGRRMAACFENTGKDVIYRLFRSLQRKGFFIAPQARKADGTYSARRVRLLSPKEWFAAHPEWSPAHPELMDPCHEPCGKASQPVAYTRTASRVKANGQSPQRDNSVAHTRQPVAPARQELKEVRERKSEEKGGGKTALARGDCPPRLASNLATLDPIRPLKKKPAPSAHIPTADETAVILENHRRWLWGGKNGA